MAPLSLTLALLATAVATVANDVVPLDMAQDSFDDRYEGCGPNMTAALPALNRSEFQKNPLFAQTWPQAVAAWQNLGSHLSPLLSPAQAIALTAYAIPGLYMDFNEAVRVAGRSPQHYRDNFHFKTLHFLLTQALAALRDAQKGQCLDVFHGDCRFLFDARHGDTVRFGQFLIMSLKKPSGGCPEGTLFQVHTCHGAGIQYFSQQPEYEYVLIPPFETFKVIDVTREGGKAQIQLRSTGTHSKYNCEWLKGGSVPSAHFHLGGLLLATTALAVATGIL